MDAKEETIKHMANVNILLMAVIQELTKRAREHDLVKLESPEAEIFEKYTARLKGATYGSDEYKQFLVEMKPALDHHYLLSKHHPEHYEDGINGMDLIDLIEMLVDWKASSMRHADGDISRSIDVNVERFGLSPQLVKIMKNTIPFLEKFSENLQKGNDK